MKKAYFKVYDLAEFLKDKDDDMNIFIANSVNICGNISELSEAREDKYSSMGVVEPCIILDSSQNVTYDEGEY